jgi:amino acid transporter
MPEAAQLKRAMGLRDLVLFNLSAVLSIRWVATAARTGPSSLTLWTLAALLFFVPQGIAVLFLSVRFPEEGGIYRWTRHAFGDFHGFFCGWCYWVNTLVYYPALLMFGASTAAYLAGPRWVWLGDRAWFSGALALLMLWIAIVANVVGLDVGKWVQNIGGIAAWLPAVLLIGLGAGIWWHSGSANSLSGAALLPRWHLGTLSFWSTIAFAFAGLELAPVMSGEIRRPRRNIPLALVVAGVVIALVYVAGTAAVLAVLPAGQVNVVTGIVQTLDLVARRAGLGSIGRLMGLLLPLSTLGGTGAWLAGSARIPFVAGIDRFLPPAFARVHPRWHTPHVAILAQGALASLFLLLSIPGGSVAETYLLLSELSIIVYFVPYLYLFLCLFRFRNMPIGDVQRGDAESAEETGQGIEVPGGKWNVVAAAVAGFAVTALAIAVSLIPSSEVKNAWLYEAKLVAGTLLFFGLGVILYLRRSQQHN